MVKDSRAGQSERYCSVEDLVQEADLQCNTAGVHKCVCVHACMYVSV